VAKLSLVAGDLEAVATRIIDGPGTSARFKQITGLAAGPDGSLYVSEFFSIRKISPDGAVTTIADATPIAFQRAGAFEGLQAISVAGPDALYVSDTRGLYRVTTDGGVETLVRFFPSTPQEEASWPADAIRGAPALATDAAGNLLLLDKRFGGDADWRVRKRAPDGKVTDAFIPRSPVAGAPDRLAVDAAGNIYLSMLRKQGSAVCAGTCYSRVTAAWVLKIAPDGSASILAGSMQKVGASDGTGDQALFNHVADIAADASGHVYVADVQNHSIRRINPQGQVTTIVGVLPTVPDAPAPATQFGPLPGRLPYPVALASAPGGRLYIAQGRHVGLDLADGNRIPGYAVVMAEGF
jgi:hypothetical protein